MESVGKWKNNKWLLSFLLVLLAAGAYMIQIDRREEEMPLTEEGLKYRTKTEGKDFYQYQEEEWQKVFWSGVNMGAALPGTFPGELAITYELYLEWFQQIKEMHADTVRVYTIMPPDFYRALFDFNKKQKEPLLLFHGVYLNEEKIKEVGDAFGEEEAILDEFKGHVRDLIDVIHGEAELPEQPGLASGAFEWDVSEYVAGWILGVEWDPLFVHQTNEQNQDRTHFKGDYLYTVSASPFEVFLAEAGEQTLAYEAKEYGMTRPLSFVNWLTTDTLTHPNEPDVKEDLSSVDTEHIKTTEKAAGGMFASYHIYPYYPDFLNFDLAYSTPDEKGEINTYRAYLKELYAVHTVPVVVAEYGVPSSRAKAHEARYSGYDQGKHSEKEQGEILQDLTGQIYEENYSGAIVFSWQDEWFKRSWNTMDYDLPDHRPYWLNVQTNEQRFGLLAFEPGEKESVSYPDGDFSDWEKEDVIYEGEGLTLSAKSDEAFLYLYVSADDFKYGESELYIPIQTINNQGSKGVEGLPFLFEEPIDFIIEIKDDENSRIRVQAYYDVFYFQYSEQLKMLPKEERYTKRDTPIFRPMELALSKELILPQTKEKIPFSKYETGLLHRGNGNPQSKEYDSLTDYAVKDNRIELAIPWQLLNIMDPSSKQQMADFYDQMEITPQPVKKIQLGATVLQENQKNREGIEVQLRDYTWDEWETPTYHARLKQSYYFMQEKFKKIKELQKKE